MAEPKRKDSDPLEGAQYGPKEPRSRMQRMVDTIKDADYLALAQSLGPTGYGIGGMAGGVDRAAKVGKASSKAKYAKGGAVKSAARRADGIAQRGRTKGRMV